VHPSTFSEALALRLRAGAGTPLVVHYDQTAGSRVELSATTFANWVAKTSALVVDELGLGRGDRLRLELPVHWLEVVWVGAALNVGLVLSDASPDLVVVGPEGVGVPYDAQVVATSLHPFALRFDTPPAGGVVDFGADVFGQPDAFVPYDPPSPDDTVLALGQEEQTMSDVMSRGAAVAPGTRTLTDVPARARPELLLGPLLGQGTTVWCGGCDDAGWARARSAERTTVEARAADAPSH
jgi:uncharacterized protein (TIGR03089 family)